MCAECCANGKQSHPLYGQMAYRIQPRRVRVEPVVLAGLLRELILELDTRWAQALELVSPVGCWTVGCWIPSGCVKSVNWIERVPDLNQDGRGAYLLPQSYRPPSVLSRRTPNTSHTTGPAGRVCGGRHDGTATAIDRSVAVAVAVALRNWRVSTQLECPHLQCLEHRRWMAVCKRRVERSHNQSRHTKFKRPF